MVLKKKTTFLQTKYLLENSSKICAYGNSVALDGCAVSSLLLRNRIG